MVMLDILVLKDGKYHAYEVKSSLKISETYLTDAALQYYVIAGAGVPLDDFSLVHVNPDYVLEDQLELNKLFSFKSVLDEVKQKQEYVSNQIVKEKEAIALKHSPKINIGVQCHYPYPCDFIGHCWKKVPENSVFQLNTFKPEEQFDLYFSGKKTINDVQHEDLNERNQQIQLLCHQQNRPFVDVDKLLALAGLENIAYLDVQFFKPALPFYKGTKPYMDFPFSIGAYTGEKELFLLDASKDPTVEFFEKLEGLANNHDYFIIYDESRKTALLKHIANDKPAWQKVLSKIVNLYDYLHEFQYYHPGLKGDYRLNGIAKNLLGKQNPVSEIIPSDIISGVLFYGILTGKSESSDQYYDNLKDYVDFKLSITKEFYLHLLSQIDK
jgi:hypothetical protein